MIDKIESYPHTPPELFGLIRRINEIIDYINDQEKEPEQNEEYSHTFETEAKKVLCKDCKYCGEVYKDIGIEHCCVESIRESLVRNPYNGNYELIDNSYYDPKFSLDKNINLDCPCFESE